jgi:hypothetical protein
MVIPRKFSDEQATTGCGWPSECEIGYSPGRESCRQRLNVPNWYETTGVATVVRQLDVMI